MDIVQYNNTPEYLNEATAADDDGSLSLQVGESSSTDYTGLLYGERVFDRCVYIINLFYFNITLLLSTHIYIMSHALC